MEVNKTMYGNNEDDVPKNLIDNFYPDWRVCDVAFAVVWNVLMVNENKSINQLSMNLTS